MRKGIEQNLVFGWESQRYHNYTTLPEEDFFAAQSIDAFNPVETQGPSDLTIATPERLHQHDQRVLRTGQLTLGRR